MTDQFIFALDVSKGEATDLGTFTIRSDQIPLSALKLKEKV